MKIFNQILFINNKINLFKIIWTKLIILKINNFLKINYNYKLKKFINNKMILKLQIIIK